MLTWPWAACGSERLEPAVTPTPDWEGRETPGASQPSPVAQTPLCSMSSSLSSVSLFLTEELGSVTLHTRVRHESKGSYRDAALLLGSLHIGFSQWRYPGVWPPTSLLPVGRSTLGGGWQLRSVTWGIPENVNWTLAFIERGARCVIARWINPKSFLYWNYCQTSVVRCVSLWWDSGEGGHGACQSRRVSPGGTLKENQLRAVRWTALCTRRPPWGPFSAVGLVASTPHL